MNKKKFIIPFAVVLVIVLAVLFINRTQYGKFFYNSKRQVDSVSVMSGNTGETVKLSEVQGEEMLGKINELKVRRDFFRSASSGWMYRILIVQDGKTIDFTVGGTKGEIDNKDYTIINNEDIDALCKMYLEK